MKLFHPDSRLMKLLTLVGQLMLLNIVWLICCIPVLTVGPSTTAMYVILRRLLRKEGPSILPDFFRAFRDNFKKSFLLNLILLIPMAMVVSLLYLTQSRSLAAAGFNLFAWIAIVVITMVWSYVWPLNAWFENSLGQTLKNAFLLPVSSPIAGLLATAMNLIPIVLLSVSLELFFRLLYFWLVLGGALIAFFNARLLLLQFRPFMPEEPQNADTEES